MNVLFIIILIFSIILHEIAHGWMADRLGDPTARLEGRLSLNPLVHIDWFGSVILPFFLVISGAPFVLGWAKPVPFNVYNLRNKKWGGALVALAGPVTNITLAIVFALLLHVIPVSVFMSSFFMGIIVTNIALAVFNLIPVPPLDGHHILFALLPHQFDGLKSQLRRYAWPILFVFVMFGWHLISPIIFWAVDLLV